MHVMDYDACMLLGKFVSFKMFLAVCLSDSTYGSMSMGDMAVDAC